MYSMLCMYVFLFSTCMYNTFIIFPEASSVTNIQVTVINPDTPNPVYSITVTCTIHDDSEADTCEVMATRNRQTPISGSYIIFCALLQYSIFSGTIVNIL